MDTRFNFYLNILPYIEPLGFWGGLIFGLVLLVYAVTRATLRLTKNGKSLDGNYAKANILQVATNAVYNPCEMKLLHSDEKANIILRNEGHDSDNLYTELRSNSQQQQQLSSKRASSYALELEPVLSNTDSSSCDEGNDSDTATLTLSRNSSPSCSDDGEANTDSLNSKSLGSDDDDENVSI